MNATGLPATPTHTYTHPSCLLSLLESLIDGGPRLVLLASLRAVSCPSRLLRVLVLVAIGIRRRQGWVLLLVEHLLLLLLSIVPLLGTKATTAITPSSRRRCGTQKIVIVIVGLAALVYDTTHVHR